MAHKRLALLSRTNIHQTVKTITQHMQQQTTTLVPTPMGFNQMSITSHLLCTGIHEGVDVKRLAIIHSENATGGDGAELDQYVPTPPASPSSGLILRSKLPKILPRVEIRVRTTQTSEAVPDNTLLRYSTCDGSSVSCHQHHLFMCIASGLLRLDETTSTTPPNLTGVFAPLFSFGMFTPSFSP